MANVTSKRAVIYGRYSTDNQDSRSTEDQFRRCERWAKEKGYSVVGKYKDEAISGSHLEREGMQTLLNDARRRGGPAFDAVLLDDLSRLSRDLGDTWRVIFEDLAAVGVIVVDCMTGVSSDQPAARMIFGSTALMNDFFLQAVKAETHRGLEGRAIGGFSTGGKVYGYSTVLEPNPSDAAHPRKVFVINEAEAEVVRRIFTMYAHGKSYAAIADTLNQEGLESPYGKTKWKERRRGWASGTIRPMLLNERYVGRFVWNKRKFVRAPGQKSKRRALPRPQSEWITTEKPDLAIVPRDVWDVVQERFARHGHQRHRPPGSGRTAYLLTGVLRCGKCGASMSTVGSKMKKGVKYVHLGCAANHNKGSAICDNKRTIGERTITKAFIEKLQEMFADEAVLRKFTEKVESKITAAQKKRSNDSMLKALDKKIVTHEGRVKNIANSLAIAPSSEALVARLVAEERLVADAKKERAAIQALPGATEVVPDIVKIREFAHNLLGALEYDRTRGRALLEKHVGQIRLTPKAEGPGRLWEVAGAFDLNPSLSKWSCGGRI